MPEDMPDGSGSGTTDPPTLGKSQAYPGCQHEEQRGPQLIPHPQEVVFDMYSHV